MIEPEYTIGDKVYLNLPDSEQGIVVDIFYSYRKNELSYVIKTDYGVETIHLEFELTNKKPLDI